MDSSISPLALAKNWLTGIDNTSIPQSVKDKAEPFRQMITLEAISSFDNAHLAHRKARKNKKRYKSVGIFESDLDNNLQKLVTEFKNETYRTGPYTLDIIHDRRKEREVAKVRYPDRVAQWMIAILYLPYLLDIFHPNTHAAILGRGIHSALKQSEHYINDVGYTHCLKIDISKYFPNVNRTVLKQQMEEDFADKRVLRLINHIIDDAPKTGIPIGNYLSQFFANRYLTPFDYWLGERCDFVRYMDDIVIFGNSYEELRCAYRAIEWYLKRNLYLDIKPNWQIFKIEDRGLDFVGYRMWKGRTILRKSTFSDMKHKVSAIDNLDDLHNQCCVMSYLGWITHCTVSDRMSIYNKYIKSKLINTPFTKTITDYYVHCRS